MWQKVQYTLNQDGIILRYKLKRVLFSIISDINHPLDRVKLQFNSAEFYKLDLDAIVSKVRSVRRDLSNNRRSK